MEELDIESGTGQPLQEAKKSSAAWKIAKTVGATAFSGMEYAGEVLASVLGITTPRYALYLDDAIEYQKMIKEQQQCDLAERQGALLRQALANAPFPREHEVLDIPRAVE
ncbi:uncharacterized protein BJ171DRAFT_582330 [Polychytrium aggregatum]|uniref:uncharacterized protein n=1 Tax=Polychytrium aggregatum TaxID=110093 RepID=UPI0022FDFF8A|nr:uncharacterized protein BJ171DRAFT_582330 [Polychytrium aggregatum]KAI9203953.1 hypothetical protein BJ171DRAFT_582330 [Polychytrium aggregatum]